MRNRSEICDIQILVLTIVTIVVQKEVEEKGLYGYIIICIIILVEPIYIYIGIIIYEWAGRSCIIIVFLESC